MPELFITLQLLFLGGPAPQTPRACGGLVVS